MPFLQTLALFVLIALLSAVAVEMSFAAAFVSGGVGYATTAYVAGLSSLLTARGGREAPKFYRWPLRVLVGVAVALGCLWLLRGPLLFRVPTNEMMTGGHSPVIAFLLCNLATAAVLELLARSGSRAT